MGVVAAYYREGTDTATPSVDGKVSLNLMTDNAGTTRAAFFFGAEYYATATDGGPLACMGVCGPKADGAAAGSYPVMVGGKYIATPTAIDDGDVGIALLDAYRRQVVVAPASATATNTFATVTTASSVALAALATRRYVMLVNTSDTIIYLALGAAAVVGSGIPVYPNGDFYEIKWGNLNTAYIAAIHAGSGNKNLAVCHW